MPATAPERPLMLSPNASAKPRVCGMRNRPSRLAGPRASRERSEPPDAIRRVLPAVMAEEYARSILNGFVKLLWRLRFGRGHLRVRCRSLNPPDDHADASLHSDLHRTSQSAVESSRDAGRPIDSSHHWAEYGKPYPTSLGGSKPTADSHEHPARTVRNMAGYHAANVSVIESHHGVCRRPVAGQSPGSSTRWQSAEN
jgi:hypothetical protein